jgi:glycosyltransferase involved in cell wall biosynthesis
MIRIGIDARELEKPAYGVARYLKNLLSSFIHEMDDARFILYFKDNIPEEYRLFDVSKVEPVLIKIPVSINRDVIWQQLYLPGYLKKNPVELFFSGQYTLPYRISFPSICTVHDLSFFKNSRWFSQREAIILKTVARLTLPKATRIIASSKTTEIDLKNSIGIKNDKITTIYPGLSEIFFEPKNDNPSVLKKYNLKNRYILWVGAILNRRKIQVLLSAFEKITKRKNDIDLVIIGEERTHPKIDIEKRIREHPAKERIRYLNYVSENELIEFYDNASLFVFISQYEGFGYTPLEAAARGVQVILSDNPTFKEIFENNAIYAEDENELANRLLDLLNKESNPQINPEFMQRIKAKFRAIENNKKVIALIKEILG